MRILPYRGAALGLAVGFSRMADHTDRPKRKAKKFSLVFGGGLPADIQFKGVFLHTRSIF